MTPKGNVLLKTEFTATKLWPPPQFTLSGMVDLEKEYKEALAGKMVTVMDIAVDDSGYLVLGESKTVGQFIWMIEKEDTRGFIPVIKKNGVIMPAGMSPIDEFAFMAEHFSKESKHYTKK